MGYFSEPAQMALQMASPQLERCWFRRTPRGPRTRLVVLSCRTVVCFPDLRPVLRFWLFLVVTIILFEHKRSEECPLQAPLDSSDFSPHQLLEALGRTEFFLEPFPFPRFGGALGFCCFLFTTVHPASASAFTWFRECFLTAGFFSSRGDSVA